MHSSSDETRPWAIFVLPCMPVPQSLMNLRPFLAPSGTSPFLPLENAVEVYVVPLEPGQSLKCPVAPGDADGEAEAEAEADVDVDALVAAGLPLLFMINYQRS